LQSYPLGGNVTMRPGTKLVKITTDPSVYAVEPNGVLRKIANESQAAALYGTNWNKRIVDVPDSFFTNYTIGQPLADGEIPVGSLVKNADSAAVYYYDGTNYRSIASEAAMNANRFRFEYVMTISNDITASGNAITGMEAGLVKTSQGATSPADVVTGSGLMVSLNSQTPVSMNIPGYVAVEMLKLNLTAASDGPVNVSGITLTAYGLSDSGYIDDVTIFDNGVKVGNSKSINSNREATFNFATPIYVAAGSTKTLTVKATINHNSGSYGLGIAKASHIVSSAANVTGSFPVNGNLMSAVEATVGKITIKAQSGTPTASFGEDNVLLADFSMEADNEEDILVQSLSLYNGGDDVAGIVSNLVLIIDGDEVATGVYANRYATFNLNNYLLEKGDNVSVEVRGDMGTTSDGDTVELYLKDANTDLIAVGKTHGFGVKVDSDLTSTKRIVVTLEAGDFTIDMDKSATPSKDVMPGADDVVLATLKMTSNGENATLNDIDKEFFYITVGTNPSDTALLLENVEMKDLATGGIYDLDLTNATSTGGTPGDTYKLELSDEISFVKGITKTFEIRADVLDEVEEDTTFKVTLKGEGMDIEGDNSGADIETITPNEVTSAITTVKKASLAWTPISLVDASIVGGSTEVEVYRAKVKAGTADGIKIQSVKLSSESASDSAFTDSNITKLSLWLDGKLLKEVSNKIDNDSTSTEGTITFNSLNTANYTVPAGKEVDLVVKADFASSLIDGEFGLKVASVDDVSARSVKENEDVKLTAAPITVSRKITVAKKGSLTVSLLTTDAKASRDSYVLAGSSSEADRYLGELKFTTVDEAIKVEKLVLTASSTVTTADLNDIAAVKLVKADGTVIASETLASDKTATFDPFNVVFEADKSTSLFIAIEAKGVNTGESNATAKVGRSIAFDLTSVEAIGDSSGEDIVSSDGLTINNNTSNLATIVGSKLLSVTNMMSDGTLTGGAGKVLGKYKLVFDNGNNRDKNNEDLKATLSQIKLTLSSTATVTSPVLYIEGHDSNAATGSLSGGVITWSDLSALVDGGKVDGEVILVVKGGVITSGENQYVQTSFASLGSDIQYYTDVDVSDDSSNSDVVETVNTMLLPVTSVNGATLSN
ncbi:MAG: hypothetical protein PWQ35_498, partial [Patescibacteria group bacterium]|nr:hypothetical protein [Patescibacteria group bacterium]